MDPVTRGRQEAALFALPHLRLLAFDGGLWALPVRPLATAVHDGQAVRLDLLVGAPARCCDPSAN